MAHKVEGKYTVCPKCGSMDELDYSKSLDLYVCAFDGTTFKIVEVERPAERPADLVMNVIEWF